MVSFLGKCSCGHTKLCGVCLWGAAYASIPVLILIAALLMQR